MTTTGKIASKGLKSTGLSETHLNRVQLGDKILAIVELVADTHTEKRDGDEQVGFSIITLEPAPNSDTIDHLRNLTRSFFYERQLEDGQLKLETADDIEPKVVDVLAAGAKHRPHPYVTSQLAVDDSEAGPVCDVCGQVEDSAVHKAAALPSPFEVPDDEDENGDDTDKHEED